MTLQEDLPSSIYCGLNCGDIAIRITGSHHDSPWRNTVPIVGPSRSEGQGGSEKN